MAEITAQMVKELREKTSAGMMDCKKALGAVNGDFEAAVNWLREKGLAAVAKKAGRVAAEGLVGVAADGNAAAMVEVNCETDFVAKNPDFQALAANLAKAVLAGKPANVEAFLGQQLGNVTVKDALAEKVATIGENMTIRRCARAEGVLGTYTHMGGAIGVIVELSVADADKAGNESVKLLAKDVAMQVAAGNPLYLRREEADAKTLDNERSIAREKAKADGKPEKILDKIVEGAVNKFLAEHTLLEQAFIKDDKLTVQKHIDKVARELGTTIGVKAMHRFKVGEGIEKKSDDLAAEVAKMVGPKS
ncbi:MAG: translation elongation factor Ts [Deltaproteobacteria bacterium RBG_16_71_12]|nr:MAG: translation elongation factor Ts [Deltaproteobacteria bacterium RBG_16_71_12]